METVPVLAYDYPVLGVFLTTMIFFVWVVWLFLLFRTFADIFRSDDLSGFAKALWILFVVFLPYLGVFVYIIARGDKMTEHDIARAQAQEAAMASYVKNAAGTGGVASELATLADLKERGVITEAEFNQQKAQLLG
jgi:Short C-terminal domain/Phospholipase_D-nuclease N-terminal